MGIKSNLKINEKAIPEETQVFIEDFANTLFAESQKQLATHNTIDRGTLLKTGRVQHRVLESEVSYPAPHAMAIEYGRAPGTMPPVNAIEGWVNRKLSVGKDSHSVAWAIATKIKDRGTQAQPFARPAIEATKKKLL